MNEELTELREKYYKALEVLQLKIVARLRAEGSLIRSRNPDLKVGTANADQNQGHTLGSINRETHAGGFQNIGNQPAADSSQDDHIGQHPYKSQHGARAFPKWVRWAIISMSILSVVVISLAIIYVPVINSYSMVVLEWLSEPFEAAWLYLSSAPGQDNN